MTKKLALFAFALLSTMLRSQSVPMAFEDWRTKDGTQNFFYKNIVKTDGSGNVFTAGATINSTNGSTDILLTKKNSSGVTLWSQQVNGTANTHDFVAGMLLNGSDVYITGTITNNTVTLVPEMFIAKYNSSGTQQYFTTYSNGYGDIGRDIVYNATNNYILVTGASYDNTLQSDVSVVAFNSSGTMVWDALYDYNGLNDGGYKITTRNNQCTVTAPVTQSTNNYKLASMQFFVSTGATSGSVTTGATATSSVEIVSDMVVDGSGNLYICGATQQNVGQGYDYYIAKVTNSLTIVWEQTLNGSASGDDFAKGIKVDASGNVFVTGVTTHSTQGKNITTIKYNSSGTLQWTENINGNYNGNDEGADLEVDAYGNIFVTGYQTVSANNTDFYTCKYNTSGTKIWEKFLDGYSQNDQVANMALDSLGNIIITGSSETAPSTYCYLTAKYVQMDVTNPVDLNGQASNKNVGFHTNRGQIRDEDANSTTVPLYYTHNLNPEIYLEKGAYDYVFMVADTVASTNDSIERIAVTFSLSSSSAKPYGYNEKGYPLHYFLGDVGDPITNIRGYDRVVTQNLYPNIDLHYFSNSNGFKYYFVVREGGDPRDIKLKINGASTTTITSNNLFIDGIIGDVTLKRPYAYMVNGAGATTTLSAASWATIGSDYYEITAPTYTTSQTLVIVVENIPPASITSVQANLDYSTYYGGNATDYFRDIKVASNGDRAVCGQSSGGTFPTANGYQSTQLSIGSIDAVLLKYTADDTLRFCTYYGAGGSDWANSVAINSNGNIFIAGFTQSIDLFVTNNSGETNQISNGGVSSTFKTDGFIIKFNLNGSYVNYGRYVGGSRSDYINSIYIDGSDNLYFTGTTSSDNLPVVNAYSGSHGTTSSDDFDMLIGKMSSSQVVSWLTYFGGNDITGFSTQEYGHDILTDNSGNVFVVGESDESSFPAMNPSSGNPNVLYDASNNGYSDGAIVRLSSGGTPDYATFLGGNLTDRIYRGLYNPTTGDLYFAGNVSSTSGFPLKQKSGAYYEGSRHAGTAAFVGYINSSLEHKWITHYGRGGSSKSFGVAGLSRDNAGLIYLSGQVYSDSLVYGSTTPSGAYTDNTWTTASMSDGFIAVFDVNQQIYHAHYFGGSSNDYIYNSDCNGNYNLYVTGNTGSANFPIAYNATNASLIDSTFNGSSDGFISRFSLYPYNLVGVKEQVIFANNVIAFPNPANNFVSLKINIELKDKVALKVYNTVGQIVHEETIFGNEQTIDCNKWASGMYIFVLSNKEFNSSFKIIKE